MMVHEAHVETSRKPPPEDTVGASLSVARHLERG